MSLDNILSRLKKNGHDVFISNINNNNIHLFIFHFNSYLNSYNETVPSKFLSII